MRPGLRARTFEGHTPRICDAYATPGAAAKGARRDAAHSVGSSAYNMRRICDLRIDPPPMGGQLAYASHIICQMVVYMARAASIAYNMRRICDLRPSNASPMCNAGRICDAYATRRMPANACMWPNLVEVKVLAFILFQQRRPERRTRVLVVQL